MDEDRDWPDIPDTPEQRALIAEHNERMRREHPNMVRIAPREAELMAEIERLGHVAAGRLRWAAMQSDKGDISFQLREWVDEMDPNVKRKEQSDG